MARIAANRALLVALVVLASAGCAADPSPTRSPMPAVTPAAIPSSTSTPKPTVAPTQQASPPQPAVWRQVSSQASLDGLFFLDVAWTGRRFVAAATDAESRGLFLDSVDGIAWHRQPIIGPVGESVELAVGPGGVVAVGVVDGHLTSWASPDGLAWSASRDHFRSRTGATSRGGVSDVVANGAGWLAVGSHDPRCAGLCAPDRALVWTSPDGAEWTEVPRSRALDDGWMNAVTDGPAGFVAVGESSDIGAGVWTSPDGLAWTLVSSSPTFEGPSGVDYGAGATSVAVRNGVTAVVGYAGFPDDSTGVLTWWSPNEGYWERSETSWVSDSTPRVAATPSGFLGTWSSTVGACLGGIWASHGPSWRCDASDPPFAGFVPVAATASGTIEVVVGTLDIAPDAESPAPPVATVWYRTRS